MRSGINLCNTCNDKPTTSKVLTIQVVCSVDRRYGPWTLRLSPSIATTNLRKRSSFDWWGSSTSPVNRHCKRPSTAFAMGRRRPLIVDVSEAQFMGVGSLRRIVLAGRGFASTEFRSPVPIVEKVLRLLGFIGGTVGIEEGASRTVATRSVDEVASMGRCNEWRRNGPENEWIASQASRQCSDMGGALKRRTIGAGVSGTALQARQDAYPSQQSLEKK